MKQRIKKISVVVYCNGNFQETKNTLYSIIDQNLSYLYYEVLILNDNANKKFTDQLNKFLKDEELINFHVFSFAFYTGMPLTFNFLIKNNIIKTSYTTIIKSGDTFSNGFLENFLDNLYSLKCDLYMSDIKDELYIPKDKINADGKNYSILKSKNIITPAPSGILSLEEAISTKPFFLGKIWKTSILYSLKLDDNKILFQDIFAYFQLVLKCSLIWYENIIAGTIRRKPWIPDQMDSKRIELLSLTLNKMISRNQYMNGQVIQLLAMALEKTSKNDRNTYLLSNFKYLTNNFEIVPIYGLSKRKILKLTKPFIEKGELGEEK